MLGLKKIRVTVTLKFLTLKNSRKIFVKIFVKIFFTQRAGGGATSGAAKAAQTSNEVLLKIEMYGSVGLQGGLS